MEKTKRRIWGKKKYIENETIFGISQIILM